MGKKRKLEEADDDEGHAFEDWKRKWMDMGGKTGEEGEKEGEREGERDECLAQMALCLHHAKDHVHNIKIDSRLVTDLLSVFEASCSPRDVLIWRILRTAERLYSADLRQLAPLVWGASAADRYSDLSRLGVNLYDRATADEALTLLDPRRLWFSLLRLPLHASISSLHAPSPVYISDAVLVAKEDDLSEVYLPGFLLPLFASLVSETAEVSCRLFVECNALSYTLACTGLRDEALRSLSYLVLARYLQKLCVLTTQAFPEKGQFTYLLNVFKNRALVC